MANFLNRKWVLVISVLVVVIVLVSIMLYLYVRSNIASGGAKINEFLARHCNEGPVLDAKQFNWSQDFRDNWRVVMSEFNRYHRDFEVPAYKDINKDSSAGTEGWKALFLRVFNNDTEMVEHFPETIKLINSCPCTTAYFSMLEPGTHIPAHKGVYKGVYRYHLSLIAPRDWHNCFIIVDGKKLHWKEPGNDIMFDDMYLHEVYNNTSERRMVLFLDIKRDFDNPLVNLVNNVMLKFIKSNDVLADTVRKANKVSKEAKRGHSKSLLLKEHPMFSGLL